jgi:hypothetical protein
MSRLVVSMLALLALSGVVIAPRARAQETAPNAGMTAVAPGEPATTGDTGTGASDTGASDTGATGSEGTETQEPPPPPPPPPPSTATPPAAPSSSASSSAPGERRWRW